MNHAPAHNAPWIPADPKVRTLVCHVMLCATILLPAVGQTYAQQPADSSVVRLFPVQRLFPRLTADGTAHQLGIAKDLQSRLWVGTVGAQRPVIQLSFGSLDLQAGIGATVQTSLYRKSPLLQLVTVDFFVDIPVDIRLSPSLTLRTGYGHHSAHLADDGIELLGIHSLNYAKDYISLAAAYALPCIGGFVYGGGRMDFHSLPETNSHWVLQWGSEFAAVSLLPSLTLYAAVDFRFKEETAWRSTQSYQIGVRLSGTQTGALRVTYTYRTGEDDRGQFYRQTADLSLIGIYLDL